MGKYAKSLVAVAGLALLFVSRHFGVTIPGLDQIVSDVLVSALVAGGVYQVRNA